MAASACYPRSSSSFDTAGARARRLPASAPPPIPRTRLLSTPLQFPSARAAIRATMRVSTLGGADGRAAEGTTSSSPSPSSTTRPRFLCLHGFRTSGEIMRRQVVGKWFTAVTSRMDLAFADAPFHAEGDCPVRGFFDPPYYEWFQFVGEDFLDYRNFDKCLANMEKLMVREGPFEGLLGFSQGALLSAALAGFQEPGLVLNRVPKVKSVIGISGGKIPSPALAAKAYASKIKCPSLHFIGDNDFAKSEGEKLLESFVDPLVLCHPAGHTVPRLDEKSLQVMLGYLDKIERNLSRNSSSDTENTSAGVMTGNLDA